MLSYSPANALILLIINLSYNITLHAYLYNIPHAFKLPLIRDRDLVLNKW